MQASFIERLIPKKIRLQRLKNKILDFYKQLPQEQLLDEQKGAIGFLSSNNISVFPYPFAEEYKPSDIEVILDSAIGLYYMLWDGKKLYHKKASKEKAQKYFNSLRLEQDIRSPHRYLINEFNVKENDIVVDVGAAEGNFSLSIIEKASRVLLFEPDRNWAKALEATFEPWKNKVTIVHKLVSDKSSLDSVSLDDFLGQEQSINFIKADVEGSEAEVIKGAQKIIERNRELKIAVCTYHRQEDATNLDSQLTQLGFENKFSDGYMLYHYGRTNVVKEPYLRKAVLRATKI